MPIPVIAYLGLGANLGEREANIRGALEALADTPGVCVLDVSTLRETDPVGGPSQPKFLNGAARIRTELSPQALLEVLRVLEAKAGRDLDAPANHPRTLDLDLLLYADQSLVTKTLHIPHPRLWDREFVLEPLRELDCQIPPRPAPPTFSLVNDPAVVVARAQQWRRDGLSIGFVPTMGALHSGHTSLIRKARDECDRVVVSIFINPLQFGREEDLARYPRTPQDDAEVCAVAQVDLLFQPAAQDLFPQGHASRISVGLEAEGLEGASRAGHFSGVATVVAKLWLLILPDRGYFGRKDAQQLAVLLRMHEDLSLGGTIVACPTFRDQDGLALSSRNRMLGPEDRRAALALSLGLSKAREAFAKGERRSAKLLAIAGESIEPAERCHLDYLALRAGDSLLPVGDTAPETAVLLVAAVVGANPSSGIRLIDNMRLAANQT